VLCRIWLQEIEPDPVTMRIALRAGAVRWLPPCRLHSPDETGDQQNEPERQLHRANSAKRAEKKQHNRQNEDE
jgi:hypothetical protein